MSKDAGITHDTAARLICLTPNELEALVKAGQIRRNDRNSYSAQVLVQDYIAHLKASLHGTTTHPTQVDVGVHVDLSDRAVRELEGILSVPPDYSLRDFRIAYIRHLRERAAGRATAGDLDLATERARLASAQAEKVEMANAVTRGELAPVALIEQVLTGAASRAAAVLDAIPGMVRRRVPLLTSDDIEIIAGEVAKARNTVATMSLDDLRVDIEMDAGGPALTFEAEDVSV